MADTDAAMNTDREIWREREGDFYSDSIHVTKMGGIGINCGGHVVVKSPRAWHSLAKKPQRYEIGTDCMVEVTQEWVDSTTKLLRAFGKAREEARHAISFDKGMALPETRALRDFLDAWKPEFPT